MFKNKVKCVIWDLDETIWGGSLAEHDEMENSFLSLTNIEKQLLS